MNQTIFLMLGLLGLVGIGAAVSGNDDDHPPEGPADDPRLEFDEDTAIGDDDSNDDQVVTGTDGIDFIQGGDGNDTLNGLAGNDGFRPGDGDDVISGGAGDDGIRGEDGDDTIDGGEGDDLVGAGYGDDSVVADVGDDSIYLGSGDDIYGADAPGVNEGNDTIYAGYGDDTITTNLGNHSIEGFDGNDEIRDYGGSVYINGEADNDLIVSPDASDPEAVDTLIGGEGADTIHAGAGDLVDPGTGSDVIMLRSDAGGAADITYGGADSITITLAADYTGEASYELVQDGEDVRLVVDGVDLAILRATNVADVDSISLVREAVE